MNSLFVSLGIITTSTPIHVSASWLPIVLNSCNQCQKLPNDTISNCPNKRQVNSSGNGGLKWSVTVYLRVSWHSFPVLYSQMACCDLSVGGRWGHRGWGSVRENDTNGYRHKWLLTSNLSKCVYNHHCDNRLHNYMFYYCSSIKWKHLCHKLILFYCLICSFTDCTSQCCNT